MEKDSEEMDIGLSHASLLDVLKNIAWHSGGYSQGLAKKIYMYQPSKLNKNLYSHFIQYTEFVAVLFIVSDVF